MSSSIRQWSLQQGRPAIQQASDYAIGQSSASGKQAAILSLQRSAGNMAVARLLQPSAVPHEEHFPPAVQDALRSQGQLLAPDVRAEFETRFGQNFTDVRIHTDAGAAASAQAMRAAAYTVGSQLVFRDGAYKPGTQAGNCLIAHELAHVVQQRRAACPSATVAQTQALECAANQAAESYVGGNAPIHVAGASRVGLACQNDRPTFGNLPEPEPNPRRSELVEARRFQLVEKDGRWYTDDLRGHRFLARGTYSFVVQNGKIWVVAPTGAMGGDGPGHTEAARGGRVEYAGMATFSGAPGSRGTLRFWTNASGHYLPVAHFAVAAGLPMDKFQKYIGSRPEGGGPQLPVFQPESGATVRKAGEKPPAGDEPKSTSVQPATPPSTPAPSTPAPPPKTSAVQANVPPSSAATAPTGEKPAPGTPQASTALSPATKPGVAPPLTGAQGQRVYGSARGAGPAINLPPSRAAEGRQAAGLALTMAMAKLEEIGKAVQDKDARSKIAATRQEIADALQKNPGVGAVIEVQFLEPEHRFQDVYWHYSTEPNAWQPTLVHNEEARPPQSMFIYVMPVRAAVPGESPKSGETPAPATEVKNAEEFIKAYYGARGTDLSGTGTVLIEMYDALQRGKRDFGFTDVVVNGKTIRITDAVRHTVESGLRDLSEKSTRRKLEALKGRIDYYQARLTEKLREWLGGNVRLTGHELDRARAHHAAAANYLNDMKFGPALESINAGETQVYEVWATLYEYDYGRRPL